VITSLNGASAVRSAEAHDEPVRRHRLVAVAGYGCKQDQGRAHCAGFNNYFIKPIDINRLAQLLEQSANTAQ
jgi:CheY-like chemotaxis protein